MLTFIRVALVAAVASAAAAGAHAQTGPHPGYNYGPQFGFGTDNRPGPQDSFRGNGPGPQNSFRGNGPGPQYSFRNNGPGPQYSFRNNGPGPQNSFRGNGPGPRGDRTAGANGGWLGVQIQPLNTNLAEALKLPNGNGALVSDVMSGSPAAAAGVMAGDVILSVDGMASNSPRELAMLVSREKPTTNVRLTVWRQGAWQDITATLGVAPGKAAQTQTAPGNSAAPAVPANATGAASLGMTIAPAQGQAGGVVVATVTPNGAAARAGVPAGATILSVGSSDVTSTADVDKAVDAARQSGSKNVLLRMKSGQNSRFVAVPIG